MNIFLSTAIAIFIYLQQANSLLASIPGLYLDKVTFGSIQGSSYGQQPGGHSFTQTWKSAQPSITSYALALYNFQTAPHGMLSYQSNITSISSTSASIVISPDISDSLITYLTFSVILITQNSSYVELLALQLPTVSSSTYILKSNKFTFETGSPQIVIFFEWVTANDVSGSSYDNYWAYIYATPVIGTSQINITRWKDNTYMKGMKMHVLLISDQLNTSHSLSYSSQVITGTYASKMFSSNFGVSTSHYGEPLSGGYCLFGLNAIDLYFYRFANYTKSTSFLFTFDGNQVSDITFSYAYEIRMRVLCVGFSQVCPYSPLDSATNKCITCRYDCLTCISTTACLSCNPSTYRQLDSKTSTCQPIQGYYDSGTTISIKCPQGCYLCQSSTYCSSCYSGYTLVVNSSNKLCKTSTSQSIQQNQQESSGPSVISIVTGSLGAAAFLGCIVCCCCRRCQRRGQEDRTNQFRGSMPSQNRLDDFDGSQPSANQMWIQKQQINIGPQECSICLSNGCNLETHCGHYFHMKCIVSWSKKVNSCPNCRSLLKEHKHKLICRICKNRQIQYDFGFLKKISKSTAADKVTVCGECEKKDSSIQ